MPPDRLSPLVVVLLVLIVPVASASSGSFTTTDPVAIEGQFRGVLPAGNGFVISDDPTGPMVLHGVAGVVSFHHKNSTKVAGSTATPTFSTQQNHTVRNATVTVDFANGGPSYNILSIAPGTLAVTSNVDTVGTQVFIPRDMKGSYSTGDERPQYGWRQGWPFFGTRGSVTSIEGFPTSSETSIEITGPIAARVLRGVATVEDEDGTTIRTQLGYQYIAEGGPSTNSYYHQWMTVNGTVASGIAPTGGLWGFGGPTTTWTLNGNATWTHATGEATHGGTTTAFEDKRVEASGNLVITPPTGDDAVAIGSSTIAPYRFTAEAASLRIDGHEVTPASIASPVMTSTGAAATVALGLLAFAAFIPKLLGAFYTRLSPDEVLRHETRARIHAVVQESGGIHKRELQRLVGGAWGPFTYHLRVLVAAGFAKVEKQGKYDMIRPVSSAPADPVIPHPVQRAVFDALPTNGTPLPFADLRTQTGISRQLLGYHLRVLTNRGLVEMPGDAGRNRVVQRVAADPDLGAQDALDGEPRLKN